MLSYQDIFRESDLSREVVRPVLNGIGVSVMRGYDSYRSPKVSDEIVAEVKRVLGDDLVAEHTNTSTMFRWSGESSWKAWKDRAY